VIGTPDAGDDLSFIKSVEAKKYLKCFRSWPKKDLRQMYPACEDRGIELLE